MDEKIRVVNENPCANASFISKLFLCWISPLMTLGRSKTIQEDDLYVQLHDEEIEHLTNKLEILWKQELEKRKPSLFRAFTKLIFPNMVLVTFLKILEEAIKIAQPILVANLLEYFNGNLSFYKAILYGTAICSTYLLLPLIHHPNFYYAHRCGMRVRLAACGLVYRKTLNLSYEEKNEGVLINMLSCDATRLESSTFFAANFIVSPLSAIAIITIMVKLIDFKLLTGLLIFLLAIPAQILLSKLTSHYKTKAACVTDKRLGITSEVIDKLKTIKMYCWELKYKELIENFRRKELRLYRILAFLTSIYNTIDQQLPKLVTYASVCSFIFLTNTPLSPKIVVFAIGYYTVFCHSCVFNINKAFSYTFNAHVSIKRIQEYLLNPEKKSVISNELDDRKSKFVSVNISKASWKSKENIFKLEAISFNLNSNKLLAIVGHVGSGKSSLLLALLGEMTNIQGNIEMNGSVFYVSQEPWIFSASIKQNIIFGKPYNRQKLKEIVKICALKEDLNMFADGENTLIGDKGANLSGGQRARISLARCVYANPDIILLDDPLSAVDANVAKYLYENCLNGYIKSKIKILVTHQVHLLHDADQIILLNNGKIEAKGKYQELLSNSYFSSLIKKSEKTDKIQNKEEVENCIKHKATPSVCLCVSTISNTAEDFELKPLFHNDGNEKQAVGSIDYAIYKSFIQFGIGYFATFLVIFLFILSTVGMIVGDYWLSYWANIEEKTFQLLTEPTNSSNTTVNISSYPLRSFYFNTYSVFIAAGVIVYLLRTIVFYLFCLFASKSFHKKMLNAIITAKSNFFDHNPCGRIMNRFSKDISNLDEIMPAALFDFIQSIMYIIGILIAAIYINYFVVIPLVPIILLFLYIRAYYVTTSREVKRIESICHSPVLVHTNGTIKGLATIRACNYERLMEKEYFVHSNYHTQPYFTFISMNRWFAIRLDCILVVYTVFVTFTCIFSRSTLNLMPSQIGVLFIYLFRIMALFQWSIRQSVDVENLMTSVERIVEYSTLETENLNECKIKPPLNWPQNGEICFDNVSFSYDESLSVVLKGVTFKINSNEKVGVIGRTGAGKSTIFQTLYRMNEPDGIVLIDGVNLRDISLHQLRSKISILPQEPALFSATLRYNLDPFGLYDDTLLWGALDKVQLKETIRAMKDGLNTGIHMNGSNLSIGQKQLICLARVILKKSKILIIDEATANVDYQTDDMIQKVIRECFKNCTVITIAHRLQTIMDSDRIMCLSDGALMHFDTPNALMENKESILFKLKNNLEIKSN